MNPNEQKFGVSAATKHTAPAGDFAVSESGFANGWKQRVWAPFFSLAYSSFGLVLLVAMWAVLASVAEDFPGPASTLTVLYQMLRDPFYVYGPNDMGIGLQLWSSLVRVFGGFSLATMVAIPLGMLMGISRFFNRIFYPVVQILKPVSPLAWFPIGLVAFQSASTATVFIIFITSIWPTLINTAFGVSSVQPDHKNVAKVFGFSRWRYLTRIVLPHSLPHIITGMRLSIGVAWLVMAQEKCFQEVPVSASLYGIAGMLSALKK